MKNYIYENWATGEKISIASLTISGAWQQLKEDKKDHINWQFIKVEI